MITVFTVYVSTNLLILHTDYNLVNVTMYCIYAYHMLSRLLNQSADFYSGLSGATTAGPLAR